MTILLDIDGVLVTTPSWKPVPLLPDGFLEFNEKAARNLAHLINQAGASVVLTTTHRVSYSVDEWKVILHTRGIYPISISRVNNIASLNEMPARAIEIKDWVDRNISNEKYVILDDDLSINDLPFEIKRNVVLTRPMIGFDDEALQQALRILQYKQ